MDNLIRHIKFPFTFDVEKLQMDVEKILDKNWVNHYNTSNYYGSWNAIALLSQGGESGNITAFNLGTEKVVYTEVMDSCEYLKEVIDSFSFEKTTARLLRLAAGAYIKPHTDNELGYEDGCFRIHIPIITNPEVEFILDNQRLIMNEGECWYINANFIHSVANKGDQDRIHLVIDGIRNAWTDALFFKEADENQFLKPEPELTKDEKLLMIAQLKSMDTEIANELIAKISKELE
ncbi:aspartyl/asparaginyl beta-hydroxylase domain-containing protein [Flavobacterium jejuense]|uniref:Aspartyl/asparaginyl beta-hydroxylase domain-containing protein n=1 Tax=Flavobacterium jejuense TaxID=1544455 RepID=A0ABX0IRN1_9FLAO|nr:aspartyl/asparaginyl beta-hydroxylase domain-containing protein [Flavobacterium jejuense]NHN24495.1 aspartyl/asparaginyl beta-hydroxylase domain-containing protein [Flavobacterium jejuense]